MGNSKKKVKPYTQETYKTSESKGLACLKLSPVSLYPQPLWLSHFDRNLSKIRGIRGENTPELTAFIEESGKICHWV